MKKLTIIIALVLLGACTPKKQGVKANTSTATIAGMQLGTCPMNAQVIPGSIFDNSAQSYNFDTRVKALLSSYLLPTDVGVVSPQQNSSVGFTGLVKLDASGNVVGTQSNVNIRIEDSLFQMGQSAAIELKFSQTGSATISGNFNTSTGQGTLLLKDNDGQIQFTGTIDAQKFSGTVSFQNTKTVVGGAPASGPLGLFSVNNCGFFQ